MLTTSIIFTLSTIFSVSHAQVVGFGKCQNVTTQKEFDVNEYLGKWYEIYKFKAGFEDGQECITAEYNLKEDGHIRVFNQGKTPNGKVISAEGDAYAPDKNDPSKLLVQFSPEAPYGKYWVIDTDYKTYTLIYSCTEVLGIRFEFAWILARANAISDDIKNKLFQELESFNVKTKNFMKTDQTAPYCTE